MAIYPQCSPQLVRDLQERFGVLARKIIEYIMAIVKLTHEQLAALQAVFSRPPAERVDWASFDAAKAVILRTPLESLELPESSEDENPAAIDA